MPSRTRASGTAARAVGLAVAALATGWVAAGEWHRSDGLICSDCHTVHNSAGGLPLRYDGVVAPADTLLRAEDEVHLCLACHDGSRTEAPDVVAPVTYLADPAGGWFPENPLGLPNPAGHDLLSASAVVAPGGTDSFVLTCSSCHATHGDPNYRNLLAQPPGSANAGPSSVVVQQTVLPGAGSPATVYAPSNLRYKSGMSAWCNDCHNDFHGRTATEEGVNEPWLRHPQSRAIAGSYGADFAHWSGALTGRVPVETPTDDTIPSADDAVFCLSCHKAHGSSRADALIFADGSTRLSTCQQCHNQ